MNHPQWLLADAITAILDSGIKPIDLSHELGFQDPSMIHRYKTGKTKTCTAIRALIIFNEYDMLLDDFNSEDHLKMLAENELNRGGKDKDKCGHIMDKLLVIASYKGQDLRSKLLRFIADYDKRPE